MRLEDGFLVLMAAVAPLTGAAQAIEGAPDGYTLVWQDDFEGSQLNEQTWNIEVSGTGGGNQELQYYRRENVSVSDGNLVLTARRESFQGKSFTSGRVNSNQKAAFKHGIMQAKIKFPKTADGLWPAYWMMGNDINRYGWPRCGEIDIIELGHFNAISGKYAGWQDRYFSGTTHYGPDATNEHHQQFSQEFSQEQFAAITPVENDEYHIFTVEWDDDYLYMYYDLEKYTNAKKRQARYFTQNITANDDSFSPGHYFQKPFYFLFNLAVGGTYTNIYDPAKITALPNVNDEAKMYVDWVRVYQKNDDTSSQYFYYDENGQKQTNIEEEPEEEPGEDNKTELSGFATEALDADGVSTFDFDDAEDVVLISTSEGVTGNFASRNAILRNYNVDEDQNFLYIWDGTYAAEGREGQTNSFGWGEGYTKYYVGSAGWSGLGFASPKGMGKDLTMLDDSYWLHFAMRGVDVGLHASHTIIVGDAQFRVGLSDGKLATVGDFRRDGEWYYFDIPLKAIRQMADPIFPTNQVAAYEGNVFAIMSGGITDTELMFDNVFFYKSKEHEVPTYTDTQTRLSPYAYKSLDENGQSVFDYYAIENVVPLSLSEDLWKGYTGDGSYAEGSLVTADHDCTLSQFYVWGDPQTFQGRQEPEYVTNSTGIYTGSVTSWASTIGSGWNGMGYLLTAERDLSMIDDSYYLHFSLRSDAAVGHIPVTLRLGSKDEDVTITMGQYSSNRPLIGDFPRDGEWYSFDIPVSVLKRYGLLWSEATDLTKYKDYILCLSTMGTYYSGSYFSFDNIFFYQKKNHDVDVEPELGRYTTKSLDADGNSYFSFEDKQFVIINVGAKELQQMGDDNIVADLSINDQTTHLWLWEGTYEIGTKSGSVPNSFGNMEGWIDLVVQDKGWTGAGLVHDDGYDLTALDSDENWMMHFAVRGTDNSDLNLIFANTHFTIGAKPHVENAEAFPVLGNFRRDGEWYSYDIPLTEFRALNSSLFHDGANSPVCYKNNLLVFKNGNRQGDELQMDNIFFWRNKQKETGIESASLSSLTDEPRIYDLQGRLVNRPEKPGIYIIHQGRKIKKVFIP